MSKAKWELAYEDWVKLLQQANAKDLLNDPLAVWDEAWRQSAMTLIDALRLCQVEGLEQTLQHIEKALLK